MMVVTFPVQKKAQAAFCSYSQCCRHRLTGQQLARWAQNIRDLEGTLLSNPGDPELLEKLAFCRQEHTKCQRTMHELDRPTYRQQHWASQGFKK
jgi:hypothetical protein